MEASSTESSSHDPYYVVQGELQSRSRPPSRARRLVHLLGAVDTCTRRVPRAAPRAHEGGEGRGRAAQDLRTTVDYVERDRAAFAHIDDAELASRRAWVSGRRGRSAAKSLAGVTSDAARRREESARRVGAGRRRDARRAQPARVRQHAVRAGPAGAAAVQMREQDESVLELEGAVTRIHAMGKKSTVAPRPGARAGGDARARGPALYLSARARARLTSLLLASQRAQGPERHAERGGARHGRDVEKMNRDAQAASSSRRRTTARSGRSGARARARFLVTMVSV